MHAIIFVGRTPAGSVPQDCENNLRDDQHDDGDFQRLAAAGLCLGVEHLVGFANDRQLPADPRPSCLASEDLQRRGIYLCEVDVVGDLERILDALHEFGRIGNESLQLGQHARETAAGECTRPRARCAMRSYIRGSSASSSAS